MYRYKNELLSFSLSLFLFRILSFSLRSPSHDIASTAVTLKPNADRLLIITVRYLSFFIVSKLQGNLGTL